MSGSSKTLQLFDEENTLSEVYSSIKHLPLPSGAVRRNPWHVECGFKECWKQPPLQSCSTTQCLDDPT